MIVFTAFYVAGIAGLLWIIDRRLRAAQAAHEAAFLRRGYVS